MSPDGPEDAPDLRHTEHEQRDIRVHRDLSADGHLARGDHTRMSRLKFSARALPRDDGERDRVFVERDAASAPAGPGQEPATPVADSAASAAESAASAAENATEGDTLMQRVGRIFGL